MTIKLIRTDVVDPCKIQLLVGEHLIGRGKLLECDDKRISRLHGQLVVTDVSLILKALHQNPCFYTKKGSTETVILRQDTSTDLCHGDRFGLLPDAYWYEVLFCTDTETTSNECDTEANTEEYCGAEENENTKTSSEQICDKSNTSNDLNATSNDNEMDVSQSLIGNNDSTEVLNPPTTSSNETVPNGIASEELRSAIKVEKDEVQAPNTPVKRTLGDCTEAVDVKKVKTEPDDASGSNDNDVKPAASSIQGQAPAAPPANVGAPNPNNAAPGAALRERCMYGASCYRRNPQHLAEFSHPRDADWGPGERGVCPYGAACLKADPRHWRDHEHPPGKLPPDRPGQRRRRRISGSDSPNQNIVHGKRIRRLVPRQDWSDGESDTEPDPYGSDDSDDWKPDSLGTSQDLSEDYL